MEITQSQSLRTGFWAVLLLSIFAWAPTTYPGYWQSTEGLVPVFNALQTNAIANVATAPDLWRGTGSATFLLVRPLLLLGISPLAAVRIIFAICFLLGGLGIYVWLRLRTDDRSAGLAGVIYMFLPICLATVYVRGSLSEAMIMGLLPLTLAGISTHAITRSVGAASIVVIALLWIWRAQAGLGLLVTLFLLLYVVIVEQNRLTLLVVLVSGLAGITSLIPIWSVQAATPVNFDQHFVHLFQFFQNSWQVAPSIPGWQDAYPFQLGFAGLGFSTVAFWLWRIAPNRRSGAPIGRLLGFGFIGVLILVVLSLPVSAPLWQWSGAQRLLTYPWQILLLAAPLLAVTAGSLPALNRELSGVAYWSVLIALVVLSSYNYLSPSFISVRPPLTPVAVFGANHDFIILAATLTESEEPHTATLEVTWQVLRPLPFDDNVFFQALSGEDAALTVVAQLDRQPLDGTRPATGWQPGEILTDRYQLDLSASPTRDNLRYYFGYYDWRDGVRLPVNGGLDDKLVLRGR